MATSAEGSGREFTAAMPEQQQVIASLRQRIRRLERGERAVDPSRISSGLEALDALLPEGGYLPGSLVEFVSAGPGDAARWLSLQLVARAMERGGAAVLVDPQRELYPPALLSLGIAPERTVIVHGAAGVGASGGSVPLSGEDWSCCRAGYWGLDQSLRCEGVAAVWGPVPTTDARWLRRFQLAAEQGGTLGVFFRPASVLRHPTWSSIQWQVLAAERRELSGSSMGGAISGARGAAFADWRFRLRLVRALSGAGREIDLRIDATAGRLEVAEVRRQLGPLAPLPAAGIATRTSSRRRGAIA